MPSFSRLIRFLATDGRVYYGDALLPAGVTDIAQATQARIVVGNIFGQHEVTDEVVDVRRLLAPLAPEDVRSVRCLGLNYAAHAKESGADLPKFPVLFYKPGSALTGPADPITVPPLAQEDGLDYECELVVVIGKRCTNVSEARALDYVLGYSVGNDVSHRTWQIQRGSGQWCYGKGFDGFAPWGPGIVSSRVVTDPQTLRIGTRVNGRSVQDSHTSDMIFSVRRAVSILSQGTTLLPGDLIFTGTPQGVGMGRKPPLWLRDGDVVEVELEQVGVCTNKVEYVKEKGSAKL